MKTVEYVERRNNGIRHPVPILPILLFYSFPAILFAHSFTLIFFKALYEAKQQDSAFWSYLESLGVNRIGMELTIKYFCNSL